MISETLRILDVGCGEGFIARAIKDQLPGVSLTAVDSNELAVETAQSLNPGMDFRVGNVYDLDFEDNSFDLVLCTEVLEHLTEPGKAMCEISRVCQKTMIITVPNEPFFCLGNLLSLKNISRLGNPKDHINHWTYSGFKKFICQFGNVGKYTSSFPWSIAVLLG